MRRPGAPYQELWSRLGLGAVLFLGVVLVYLTFHVSRFETVADWNALDYAQIARHVYRGEGFTTSFIKPLSLAHHRSVADHPDLTYPPLHILWTSVTMHVFGPVDRAVAHSSGLAFILTAPLVFFMGLRLFDLRTASLATVLYATNGTSLDYAISGLEASLLGLLVTALLLVLYLAAKSERHQMTLVAIAGVVMGLIYLTKYIWLMAAIPALVYLLRMDEKRGLARAGVFVALAIAVALPWLVRNQRLTGNPFFTLRTTEILGQTKAYPGNSLYRRYAEYVPSFFVFAAQNPKAVLDKIRAGLARLYRGSAALAGVYLSPFFLVAILVRLRDESFERWRNLIYGMLVVVALALIFVIADLRLLAPAGPVMTVIAVGYFWRLATDRTQDLDPRAKGRIVTAAVTILVLAHVFPFVVAVTPGPATTEESPDVVQRACEQLAERVQGPVATDVPWAVAWLADRDAIWLPQSDVDLRNVEQAVGPLQWLLLTPLLPRVAVSEKLERWADVWRSATQTDIRYGDFVVRERLADGTWILMQRSGSGGERAGE
jgi:4-amino-4-deoxy-L-arabinose transferase-like glycosyltransferase